MTRAHQRPGAWLGACLGLLSAFAAGCAPPPPPTEGADVVTSPTAPAFKRLIARPADRTMRRGEVLSRVGGSRPFSWRPAPTEDERKGKVFPARRAGTEGTLFVFESDVARNVGVPPVSWFCDLLHDPTLNSVPCRNGLFRLRISPRRFAAYIPCIQSQCPLVVIGDKSRHLSYIRNLQDVRLVELSKRTLALATHHWTKGAAWTGTDVVVFEVAPSFRRLAEVTVEETDARGEVVRAIRGRLEPRSTGLALEGESIHFDRASTQRRASERLHMSWGMTAEGRFVRNE